MFSGLDQNFQPGLGSKPSRNCICHFMLSFSAASFLNHEKSVSVFRKDASFGGHYLFTSFTLRSLNFGKSISTRCLATCLWRSAVLHTVQGQNTWGGFLSGLFFHPQPSESCYSIPNDDLTGPNRESLSVFLPCPNTQAYFPLHSMKT